MENTSKLLPRLTLVATSAAPWLFAFLLVGCNFQANMDNLPALVNEISKATGIHQEKPQISLEIPNGYTPAKKASEVEKSWEQVALDAERMAFQGPAKESAPAINAAALSQPVTKVLETKAVKPAKKVAKLPLSKKRYASNGKFWKPVKLTSKKVGYRKVGASKLASTY